MSLSCLLIKNYNNINSFSYQTEYTVRNGEANTLYFQLVDLDQNDLRYMPASGATLTVSFMGNVPVVYNAVQVNSAVDPSLWSVTISASDTILSGNILFALTQGSQKNSWVVGQGIQVEYTDLVGGC